MRAYERFIDYVKIHTTSDDASGMHPSFKGEFDLAHLLEKQLEELGLCNVMVDEHCYVYGLLPATKGYEKATPIGFIAHMDTAPDASGKDVKPVFHENYDGKDIVLENGLVIGVDKFPFLADLKGETLITTDGNTLLGADDKAGIAEIMTAVETIINENIPHGDLWVGFTPDEEIGEGADFFNLDVFKAKFAYTVDGGDVDCLEYENFNAAGATVTFKGLSVHPGDAKDKMLNASNVAMEFHTLLPATYRPEHTEGREGFFHLTSMEGCVSEAVLKYIIRDHDRNKFEFKKKLMEEAAKTINSKYGEGTVVVKITDSYYNMLEKIEPHMHLIEAAADAIKSLGYTPKVVPVRGGTDGARLSYEGLPCPNLGTGGFNYHGEREGVSVQRMDDAVKIVIEIVKTYSKRQDD